MRGLQMWPELPRDGQEALLARHRSLIDQLGSPTDVGNDSTRSGLMDRLTEMHPLAQVLVRNRKSELGIVSRREAHRVPVRLGEEAAALYKDISEYIRDRYNAAVRERNLAVGFVMVTYQRMLTSSSQALRTSLLRRAKR